MNVNESTRSTIPRFTRGAWESGEIVTRIGGGGIGGKATGLWELKCGLLGELDPLEFPGVRVTVPRMVVLGTDVFDAFMELNGLRELALSGASDARIGQAFLKASLPPEFLGDLRDFIAQVDVPLAVRSSSLLEDALKHPFAGVYVTKMIPNNQTDTDSRFRALDHAIRFVFAATYFKAARDYFEGTGHDQSQEKMAVIIQEVVGDRHGDRFYPRMSGVARSFNYYPSGAARPTDGVVNLALGLGRTIVDGGLSWSYSPAYPAAPPPFKDMGERMRGTQTSFWSVNMGTPPLPDPMKETEYLLKEDLTVAEDDGELDHLVSTYDPQADRLRMGLNGKGPRVLDFAPILVGETLPLNGLMQRLFPLAERTAGCPVELEFAIDTDHAYPGDHRLCLLQMRPMATPDETTRVAPVELSDPGVVVAADRAMGNGSRADLFDIVYLKPDAFKAAETMAIATEVEKFNRELRQAGRPYVLIGFGRWGSSDPWLGVPVDWGQISGASVIVETSISGMNPDPSQGAHFFHNLIGLGVFYLTASRIGGSVDWSWLEAQPTAGESKHVRHLRLAQPMAARVDGLAGLGVVERKTS
jgi:hypothetical protein